MCPDKVLCYLNQERELHPSDGRRLKFLVPMSFYLSVNFIFCFVKARQALLTLSKQLFLFQFTS